MCDGFSFKFETVKHVILNYKLISVLIILKLLKIRFSVFVENNNLSIDHYLSFDTLQSFKNFWICFVERKAVSGIEFVFRFINFGNCSVAIPLNFKYPVRTVKGRKVG